MKLLRNSTLFTENSKKVLAAAFLNGDMSVTEADDLFTVLQREQLEMGAIDNQLDNTIAMLKKRHGINE